MTDYIELRRDLLDRLPDEDAYRAAKDAIDQAKAASSAYRDELAAHLAAQHGPSEAARILSVSPSMITKHVKRHTARENTMTSYAAALDATDLTSNSGTHEVWVLAYEPQLPDDMGNPVFSPTDQIADAVSTGVRFGVGSAVAAQAAADRLLAAQGWVRTGDWHPEEDAIYADVERAAENTAVTADHIRALAATEFGGSAIDNTDRRYPVLARDADGDIRVMVADTAIEQGAATLYTRPDLDAWLDGTELSDDDAVQIAVEVNENLAKS